MAEKKTIELEVKSNLGDAEKSLGSLKSQLRQAQAEVGALSDKFGATSKEAVNAAKKAAELADRIGDAKALTEAFNPDAKFRALSGALGGVAGGFSAVTGLMGALGTESKDVEAAILKVQSAMAISSGLQAVGESIDQFKILATVIKNTSIAQRALTIYQSTYNYVMAATTTGLKLLRGALIATGIGAAVVAVGMLIANFDKIKATILRVIPALSLVGDGVMFVVHAITDFIGATSEAEREVERLSGAASKSLKNNEQYLKEHGSQLDEYTKQKVAAKNEYLKLVEEDAGNQRAYALELNRKLKKIDDDRLKSKKENKKEEVKTVKETNKEISAEEQRRIDEEQKRLADEMQSANDAMAILDEIAKAKETPAQKELREYNEKKAVLEANNLDTAELTNQFLTSQADAEYAIFEEKLAKKKEQDDKKAQDEIEAEKRKNDAIATSKQNLNNIISNLESSGIAKTKAGQVISKAIALTQIGIDSAVAISKASTLANAEGVAAQLAFPLVPGIGTIARVVSYASTAATVIGNIARAKQLLSSGGGGGGGSAPSGGGSAPSGGGGSAPAAPSFNVVGASSTNQLAQTIGNKEAQPIKAYVVANDVTTQQSLERNIISSASIG
jgi:hypothetical protein